MAVSWGKWGRNPIFEGLAKASMTAAYSAFHPKNKRLLLGSSTSVKDIVTYLQLTSPQALWRFPWSGDCAGKLLPSPAALQGYWNLPFASQLLPLPCRLITSFFGGVQLLCNPKTTSKGQFMPRSLEDFSAHPQDTEQDTQCQQSSLVSLLSLDAQHLPFGSGGNFSAHLLFYQLISGVSNPLIWGWAPGFAPFSCSLVAVVAVSCPTHSLGLQGWLRLCREIREQCH